MWLGHPQRPDPRGQNPTRVLKKSRPLVQGPPSVGPPSEDGDITGDEAWHTSLNYLLILQVTCVQVTIVVLVPCKYCG